MVGKPIADEPPIVVDGEYWGSDPWIVRSADQGGAGFDACWYNSIRIAVREAVRAASAGTQAHVDMDRVAGALWPGGFAEGWRAVHCIENHDEVYFGRDEPIRKLSDPSDPRSWYARSRSRVAAGLLLTALGIPMLFMGQEFLEDKQWSDDPQYHPGNMIWWDGLDYGKDRAMVNFHRFIEELVWLRRSEPALRGDRLNVFHRHSGNRILAFHRWVEWEGRDVVVVVSLNDSTYEEYELGWPAAGGCREIFNSDVYEDHAAGPAGNGGWVDAWWDGRDVLPATARITIPANSVLVFGQ